MLKISEEMKWVRNVLLYMLVRRTNTWAQRYESLLN